MMMMMIDDDDDDDDDDGDDDDDDDYDVAAAAADDGNDKSKESNHSSRVWDGNMFESKFRNFVCLEKSFYFFIRRLQGLKSRNFEISNGFKAKKLVNGWRGWLSWLWLA